MVTTTTPGGQRVSICTCKWTGCHLATFTRRPGSSLYTLATEPPQVAASAQVSELGPVAPPSSCCLLLHQTLLWHHRLGHPSLPRLRGMHSRLLVSGLPRSLPPLPPSPAPPCLPCVEGRQRAAPHSSSFPPTTAPLQTLHQPAGGEFSSDLLREFCRGEGILQSFTLRASLQQNGIAESRIGLVMDVARTSMIHAVAPHFLWTFAVRYASHQLNLRPRVSLPETSPTLRWTGKVGDASFFRDVMFDESVPFYHLFPYRTTPPPPPPPLFLAPGPPPLDPLPPQGPAPSGVSQVDPLPGTVPVEVVVDSSAARGATSRGATSGGPEPGCAEPGGTEPEGAVPRGAESEGAELGGVEPRGTESAGGPAHALPRVSPRHEPLSPQQLREWFAQCTRLRGGGTGAGGARATSTGGAGVTARATSPGDARTRGTGAGGTGAGGAGAGGARAGDPGAGGAGGGGTGVGGAEGVDPGAGGAGVGDPGARGTGAGGTVQRRPFYRSVAAIVSAATKLSPSSDSFTECREPESRHALPIRAIRTGRRVPHPHPPPVLGTHVMALRRSFVPLRVSLPPPPASSLPTIPDPEYGLAHAASPTVPRLLATVVTDPSFESTAASALIGELVDFTAACRLDYATSLVAESESDCPPSVGGECALGTDVLEDRQEDFECLAAIVPHLVAILLTPEGDLDAPDIPTPHSYVEAITAQRDYELHPLDFSTAFLQGSRHEEIWLRRPPCFTRSFPTCTQWSLRRPVYGLRQAPCEWHNTLRTTLATLGFDPSTADPSVFLRTDTSLPPFYVLVYIADLVFATADTEVLQRFSFWYSSPQSTPLPTGYLLSAPPSDESIEPSGPYPELVGCLMYLMTYTRSDLAYPLSILERYVVPERYRPEHSEAAKRVLRYLCSTSGMGLVLGGRGPVVLTGHADASWVDDLATQRSS
ncbi:unnamed protein product [Closterium sp. NIES-54]